MSGTLTDVPPDMAVVLEAGGEMGGRVARFDWSQTPLGPIAAWPPSIRSLVRTSLTSRFPIVLWFGRDLTLIYNDGYRSILGEKHPWALGRHGHDVWSEIWDVIGPMLHGVVDTGVATWSDDQRLVIRRGGFLEEGFFTFTYSPVHDETGAVSGVFCAVHETTQKVIGERRLRSLRVLADRLSEARTEHDVHEITASTLAALPEDLPFLALYGLAAGTAQRRVLVGGREELFPAALAPGGGWLSPAPATGELPEIALPPGPGGVTAGSRGDRATVVPLLDRNERTSIGWLVCGLNPLRQFDDEYVSFVRLVASHIAGALATVRALDLERERAAALAELDQAKTAFLSNVSHEFRTPLTLMLGPLEDVLATDDQRLPAAQRRRIALAHRNGLRLLKLVNGLLDFSRMEAGRLAGTFAPVDLGSLTADLVSVFRSAIERAGLRLDLRVEPLGQPTYVDIDMWETVIFNLLSNALKYTHRGSISVLIDGTESDARVVVRDTGVGIDATDVDRVFERFYRAGSNAGRSVEGAGIGLSLARDLVTLHGGTISVSSEPGAGTSFTITLPWGAGHLPADQVVPTATPRQPPNAQQYLDEFSAWLPNDTRPDDAPADADGQESADVLVVDDNADMRRYLQSVLSERWTVQTAANGDDALAAARRDPPDLVVTDVMMPGMDGFELLARLRAEDSLRDIPVLMLSARAGQEAAIEGLDAGADDYLVKPFTAAELTARIQARLDGSDRLAAEIRRNRRAERLGAVATALNACRTMSEVTRTIFEQLADTIRRDMLCIGVVDRSAAALRIEFAGAIPPDLELRYRTTPLHAVTPLNDLVHQDRRMVLDQASLHDCYPHMVEEFEHAGVRSAVGVPLHAHDGAVIGGLIVTRDRPELFQPDDVMAVELLADTVADAVGRVQLYELARSTSETLQHGLLDVNLETPHAVWRTRYRPAAAPLEVGGDWYDLFALDEHRLGVTIGDVVGHGLAAATTMGQLRSALSAAALDARAPSAALHTLDRYAEHLPAGQLATVAYAVIDPLAEQLQYCAAGHPPPLLVTASGDVRLLDGGRSWPLLGDARRRPDAATVAFPAGSMLVLYTDGLVERRGESLDVGLDALVELARAIWNQPTGIVCDTLLARRCRSTGVDDDVALVAVRTVAARPSFLAHAFGAEARNLAPTRRVVRRWLEERGLPDELVASLVLAVNEACSNAVEHASGFDPRRVIGVELAIAGPEVIASVSDTGYWKTDAVGGHQAGRGRGFTIMHRAVDGVEVATNLSGTTVTLRTAVSGHS